MRLLLDTHHSPVVARLLTGAGHDVVAAGQDPRLASLPDEDLLAEATAQQRSVVTENIGDVDALARRWATTGRHHAGIVFTSPRRFHRGSAAYPANLVTALGDLLRHPPQDHQDWVHWLP